MLLLNRRAAVVTMVLVIFGLVGSAGVLKFVLDQGSSSLYAKEVARTYGEAYKIAFQAGKAMTALPEESVYDYKTKSWKAPCTIKISSRFVQIEREYAGNAIDVQVPLPIPLTWRSTTCTSDGKPEGVDPADYAHAGCHVAKADTVNGVVRYTDSIKFETDDVGQDSKGYYTCGDKLRFTKFKAAGNAVTDREYEKLWVRKV